MKWNAAVLFYTTVIAFVSWYWFLSTVNRFSNRMINCGLSVSYLLIFWRVKWAGERVPRYVSCAKVVFTCSLKMSFITETPNMTPAHACLFAVFNSALDFHYAAVNKPRLLFCLGCMELPSLLLMFSLVTLVLSRFYGPCLFEIVLWSSIFCDL